MNGEVNPNAGKMGGFGQNRNHMKSGGDGGGVNMADLLPKDPFKDPLSGRGKWMQQSAQAQEKKQAELAAEQAKFVPEAFKRDGAMNLDIKGNKATGKETTWLDNNSNIQASQQAQKKKQRQQQPPQQHQQQQQYSPMNQNSNHNNNPNHGHGQNSHSNNHKSAANNMGMPTNNQNQNMANQSGNNPNSNMSPHNMPQRVPPVNRGGVDPNANQTQPRPTFDMTQELSKPQGVGQDKGSKPKPEPYYSHKQADPFTKFYNNGQHKRDFQNHGNAQGGYHNKNLAEPNYRPYNAKPNTSLQQQQNLYSSGKKESDNWSGLPNKFSQKITSRCTKCAAPIQDTWTEDSQERMFHDECFVCLGCGSKLGPMGNYTPVANGVMCRQCRTQQLASQ